MAMAKRRTYKAFGRSPSDPLVVTAPISYRHGIERATMNHTGTYLLVEGGVGGWRRQP